MHDQVANSVLTVKNKVTQCDTNVGVR